MSVSLEFLSSPPITICMMMDSIDALYTINRPDSPRTNGNAPSITAPLRFDKEMNTYLSDLYSTLVPFPRLHFMITSMAPILCISNWNSSKYAHRIQGMAESCLSYQYFFVKLSILMFHPFHSY